MTAKLFDMPARVRGYIKETCEPDGDYYTIVLNSRLSHEQNCETYLHELKHMEEDDFHSERSVQETEYLRHNK